MTKTLIALGCSNKAVLRERATAAALLIQRTQGYSKVILSGGLPKDGVTEAEKMHDHIEKLIPSKCREIDFILEGQSKNTAENLKMIDDMEGGCLSSGNGEYDVLSSRSHLWGVRDLISVYPSVQSIACEEILKKRVLHTKRHKHHLVYWGYEIARPIAHLPGTGKLKDFGKKMANKS